MDLRRLEVFRAVAELGSFSGAALELSYTQSVVSHHVATLERELGVTLFERGRRPVRLTPAGERLNAHAPTILGAVRTAEADLRAIAGLEAGTLRVGAFLSAWTSFVPAAIAEFSAAHPNIQVDVAQHEPTGSLPRLVAGELDLAVVWLHEGEELDPRLRRITLTDDHYRVVLPERHRLARRKEIRLEQLAEERFAAPRAIGGGVEYRALLEGLCEEAGFTPEFAYSVDDVTVTPAFVAAGLCVAVMPQMTIPPDPRGVIVKPLAGADPYRTVHVMSVKRRRAPGVDAMTTALERAATERFGS
jgi:DNA-binding transcriptional LysR family regulator